MKGNHLVREARKRAGLTQSELASRAGTTQSAVARLERGKASPTLEYLTRLLLACGFDLQVRLVPREDDDWTLVEQTLHLNAEDRLGRMISAVRFAEAGREQMARARGG